MEENSRAEKLRLYLIDVIAELNVKFTEEKQINFNFLDDKVENYSLDKIPTDPTTENWIIGADLCRDTYSFRYRTNYSADTILNMKNVGFFESFEQAIKKNNYDRNLPDIKGIQSIACLNCGTMQNAVANTAEFDIQIMIEYIC